MKFLAGQTFAIALALCLAFGLYHLADPVPEAVAQMPVPAPDAAPSGPWTMFAPHVGGGGQSTLGLEAPAWLYNRETGAVYRVIDGKCQDTGAAAIGCVIGMPVFGSAGMPESIGAAALPALYNGLTQ